MNAIVRGGATLLAALVLTVAAAPAAHATAPDSAATHEAAARELFLVFGGPRIATAAADAMMQNLLGQPDLVPYQGVVREWCTEVFGGEEFQRESARLYMKYFSEDEIRGLTTFYRTPLGQRALEVMPQMMREGAVIGGQLAERHQEDLTRRLEQVRAGGKSATPSKGDLKQKR